MVRINELILTAEQIIYIMDKPEHKFMLHRGLWCVYKMTYSQTGAIGSKLSEYDEWEDAKKETYRLNGWKYKPNK